MTTSQRAISRWRTHLRLAGTALLIVLSVGTYVARQLHDFKTGARHGTLSVLMQPVVAGLGADDMMVIAAYVASLPRTAGDEAASAIGGR